MFTNPYKSYPKCPVCGKIGQEVEKAIRECPSEDCKIRYYWFGGHIGHSLTS